MIGTQSFWVMRLYKKGDQLRYVSFSGSFGAKRWKEAIQQGRLQGE